MRRRDLLPLWLKIYTWVVFTLVALSAVLMTALAVCTVFDLDLFSPWSGSEPSNVMDHVMEAFSIYELVCLIGLWLEEDWAAKQTMLMARIGIVLFGLALFAPLYLANTVPYFNLALLIMVPILLSMRKTRSAWEEMDGTLA